MNQDLQEKMVFKEKMAQRETLENRAYLEKLVKKERWGYPELSDPLVNLA